MYCKTEGLDFKHQHENKSQESNNKIMTFNRKQNHERDENRYVKKTFRIRYCPVSLSKKQWMCMSR